MWVVLPLRLLDTECDALSPRSVAVDQGTQRARRDPEDLLKAPSVLSLRCQIARSRHHF